LVISVGAFCNVIVYGGVPPLGNARKLFCAILKNATVLTAIAAITPKIVFFFS
jgi:hypothetical protein